ncbi:MAG: NAD(P)-dependent oxidoreductase [bacterium]
MNILVTGAKGFIGNHLADRLKAEGHTVFGFDVHLGDITHLDALDDYLNSQADHVFHLAGKTYVPESWENPGLFYLINVQGTNTVLEFCRKTGAALTFVSSYLYGQPKYLPIDEKHPLHPFNPYSHSKLLAEQLVTYFTETFGLRTTIFRPFNAYGPNQASHFIIPEIIGKLLDPDIPEVVVNDLRPKRDYIFVEDMIDAFLLSLSGLPGIYNLGSGFSLSVQEIIDNVASIAGVSKPCKGLNKERPGEIFDLFADISLAKTNLGWIPATQPETGLRKCIEAIRGR